MVCAYNASSPGGTGPTATPPLRLAVELGEAVAVLDGLADVAGLLEREVALDGLSDAT